MEEPEEVARPADGEVCPPARRGFWRRNRWLWWLLGAAGVVLAALSIVLAIAARNFEPYVRARIIAGLEDRFHTRVELDHFHVSVHHGAQGQWGLWATGQGLRVWQPPRPGGDSRTETAVQSDPLIQLDQFNFHLPLRYKTAQPLHISEVRLKGLQIHIPPRPHREKKTELESSPQAGSTNKPQAGTPLEPQGGTHAQPMPVVDGVLSNVVVDKMNCIQGELVIETDKPGRVPLTFAIQRLSLTHLSRGDAMLFDAELTNPRPRGDIVTTGSFGPLDADDPGTSPLNGKYTFQHANLSDFKGIAGTLSSTGAYSGTLRDIVVDGQADVPDFQLSNFAAASPLHTEFHARVDGTDGDTWLDQVNATLGHSHFSTSGQIVRVIAPEGAGGPVDAQPVREGHVIDLKIDIPHGAIEDFLHLVTKSGSPLVQGAVESRATLHISPGSELVYKRMKLDGQFKLDGARFTSDKVQSRIQELSERSQGRPKTTDPVTSQMDGTFHMAGGIITLPDFEYNVPGAEIHLTGTYTLEGSVNFTGTARMQATVSQMVGGWKGFLLKPADRFFRKDGAGTEVPIKIEGSHDAPEFSLDFGHGGGTHPERPGGQK